MHSSQDVRRRLWSSLWRLLAVMVLAGVLWNGSTATVLGQSGAPAPAPAAPVAQPAPAPAPTASVAAQAAAKDSQAAAKPYVDRELRRVIIVGSYLLVGIVVLALLLYMWALRKQMATSQNDEAKSLFPHMALGLPDGSIRAGLAILIVVGSLLSLMGAVFPELEIKAPEALTGVFGTILGFYFGRSGGAESAEASRAIQAVATNNADADKRVQEARQQTQQAQDNFAASEDGRAKDLAATVDPLLSAATALVDATIPADLKKKLGDSLAAARSAVDKAKAGGKPDEIAKAVTDLQSSGPIATAIAEFGPALAPLVPAGTTAAALRALAGTAARLSPNVAQHWTARLMNTPSREDLITPSIDDQYAKNLLGGVPDAAALLQFLKANIPPGVTAGLSPTNDVDFVKLALRESSIDTIKGVWGKNLPTTDWAATIRAIQQRAVEVQLESEIPADLMQPYGGFAAFFSALNDVQSAAGGNGLRALDILMTLQDAARQAGVAVVDLLPS